MTSHTQAWLLPCSLGVLAILGLLLLYFEVREAVKKSKPVPIRIDRKLRFKLLNAHSLDKGRPHSRTTSPRRGEAA
jgi:hypothetical protein